MRCACAFALANEGRSMLAKIPIMAITTNNSISVKAAVFVNHFVAFVVFISLQFQTLKRAQMLPFSNLFHAARLLRPPVLNFRRDT
jgi:hypothetical protein